MERYLDLIRRHAPDFAIETVRQIDLGQFNTERYPTLQPALNRARFYRNIKSRIS